MGSRRAMRPLEARFDQLPDMTPVAPYPGMTSRIQTLCRSVTAARSSLEPWDIISATGRRIQIPRGKEDTPLCSAAVACALADLRDTVNGACTAFAWDEHGLWHLNASTDGYARWHPIASIQSECGITAAEHRSDIEEYVRHAVVAEPRARIVHGVKFKDRGFCRDEDVINNTTITVYPGHPMWDRPWALDMSDIAYDETRVHRFRQQAVAVVYPEAVEALARMVAAPVCQPYMHGIALLSGKGGKGKGSVLKAMTGLYGELAKPFSMAGLLGVNRASSTLNEQAGEPLVTSLFAYDSDSVRIDGRGMLENVKKATAGEEVMIRKLQQNVAVSRVTAFMAICTNHMPAFDMDSEWDRRIWNVPFRTNTTEAEVKAWREYVGDERHPGDGIIDALMAGALSFASGHPDPRVAPRITDQLTDYGTELLDTMMTCAPLDNDGMPIDARVPANAIPCRDEREKREQRNMMGLSATSKRDIRGDKALKQMVYIKDPARFKPFAERWLAERAAIAAEDEARRTRDKTDEEYTRDKADEEYTRHILMEAPRFESMPGVAAQIEILREVDGLKGTLLTPAPSQWKGKGITAKWKNDATIRRDLRTCDLTDLPDRCGLSLAADVLILDLDAADPDDPSSTDGTASLMRIPGMTRGMLDTLVMRSPHGAHVCYRLPADLVGRVKASTHVGGTRIDLRPGVRSYVIAPGSRWHDEGGDHAYPGVVRAPMPDEKGRRILPTLPAPIHRWLEENDSIDTNHAMPAPAPTVGATIATPDATSMPAPPAMEPDPTPAPSTRPTARRRGCPRRCSDPIERGRRNDTLFRWGRGLSRSYNDWADHVVHRGHSSGLDDREINGIIASINNYLGGA